MRIGLLGGGVIARVFLEHAAAGRLEDASVVAVAGRSADTSGRVHAESYVVPFVIGTQALVAARPEVVVEAASHAAVAEHAERLLRSRIAVIVLSGGALADDALRERLERAATETGAMLYVPSGGIGGLDALKAACAAGVDEVRITIAKPPAAWKGIEHVERLGIDLDRLAGPVTLFDGTAREGVPHFPANVNIAAVLSLAGVGFDRTRLTVMADPALPFNTHLIKVRGTSGSFEVRLENVPSPDNPKTAVLACHSALAAVRQFASPVRYGT